LYKKELFLREYVLDRPRGLKGRGWGEGGSHNLIYTRPKDMEEEEKGGGE